MDVAIDPRLSADENINLLLTRNSLTVRMLTDLSFGDPTAISVAEPTRTGLIITITGEEDTMAYPILYRRSDLAGIVENAVYVEVSDLLTETIVAALNNTRGFNLLASELDFEVTGPSVDGEMPGQLKAKATSKLYIGRMDLVLLYRGPGT